ncbi:NACHT, LRR and PYD domains-containing protein 12 [Dipodomys spectabilis]|uniref:NACHT, LRR and PYD domains-containing protein 12 n=1 Tax=Dipodomys spectabilis TaxID=105255 RepID=UPI001C53C27B|nr:NACHT, LRR and PYD domains-containing protein 12 [Dipodomys spectabilis]
MPIGAGEDLCRLSAYLEELEAAELKKFKFYLGAGQEGSQTTIPWGRMEAAGPLEMAQLLVAHLGTRNAWLLALSTFERIHRRDLWERGQREDATRVTPLGPGLLGSQSAFFPETCPGPPRKGPGEYYREHVRRRFGLMEDRNARLGECVHLSHRYTRLLVVKEHSNPTRTRQKLLDTSWGPPGSTSLQASPIQMETLFEPDEERPEPPRTVVLQGAAGIGKSMLVHKLMLDWAAGDLFRDRFAYIFYINCREMNCGDVHYSARDLISDCWPEPIAPLQELLRAPHALLFILDGFDELKPSAHDPGGPWCSGWEEKRPPRLLLHSLIQKKLLPEVSLLITTRPSALETLQPLLEHPRHVEILGFSEAQREEYFSRFFPDARQAQQAFGLVRDNEPLFAACFVPLVCWVVCTCLRQQLEAGGLLRQTSRTTTAVYLLYLLSLVPGTPTHQGPRSHPGLCSLAAHGLWNRKVLFLEEELLPHGLEGADVSAFLNTHIFQKDIGREKFYSFTHLSFQEFFGALFYILDGAGPERAVTQLLAEYGFSERSFWAVTVRFLFGLLNEELRNFLERHLGWKTSPHVKAQVLEWLVSQARSQGPRLQHGALELLSCLYEIQEEAFVRRALHHVQVLHVSHVATAMEHVVCSFCARHCENAEVLHLQGAASTYGTEAGDQDLRTGPAGGPIPSTQPPERNLLPGAYSEHLAAALGNPGLVELALCRSALGTRGVRLLCQGLTHPSCRLQNLRLKRCHVPGAACRYLAAALTSNQHLLRLDLSGNRLGSEGLALLGRGLRHPRCRLQMLQLRKCLLDAEAGRELAVVLSASRHLLELDLTGNLLQDVGLERLCEGLKHPGCPLQTLWLKICHLTAAACVHLAAALGAGAALMELDLSLNDLGDQGPRLLSEGLAHPACKLQTLRLGICRLGPAACGALSHALQLNSSLRDLDLSFNDVGDAGVQQLGEGLQHPTCRLQKLWLDSCGLTAQACEHLSSSLATSQTLSELYLTHNALGDAGVQLLCQRLALPGCRLRVLWLFGMQLNKSTHRRLAALQRAKPHLDLGC